MSYPLFSRPGRFGPALGISIAALLLPLAAFGQSTGTVSGIVRDAKTRAPLKAATATVRDAADSTAKTFGAVTGESGTFTIENLPVGKRLRLEIRYVGYETHVVEDLLLTDARPSFNAGEVLLQQGAVDLKGVQVTGERAPVTVLADKTVYAVENNPSYTATNVSELLGQVPSIQVDQDGKITLRGEENITIMMNDRPLTMPAEQRNKYLQSLPANMVKDIEVRTNPGAQFDAKNQGGIINIVTRRTMSDMFGGNANLGVDSRKGINGGAGLYYNGEDLNGSIGGGIYSNTGEGSSSSLRLDYRDSIERLRQGAGSSESESGSYYGYGQVDYQVSENDLASLSFNMNHWTSEYSSFGSQTFYDIHNAVVGRFFDTSDPGGDNSNDGGYATASFLFRHTFSENHKLGLDVSYSGYSYSGRNNYSSTFYNASNEIDSARGSKRRQMNDQLNGTIIGKLDYENALNNDITLTLGAKNEINKLDNERTVDIFDRMSGEFVTDTIETTHYLPKNSISALYGNVAYKLANDLSMQLGLRGEYATVSAEYASGATIVTRDYTNIFPSGSLAYNITDQQSLTLSYRRSIALPDIDALNPTKFRWNDFYQQSGNPNLDPEFTHTVELNYGTFWGMGNMASIAPYYSTTIGNIEKSQRLENGVTYATSENFNGAYSIGTELSLGMRPIQWLNFRVSGNIYRKVNRGSAIPGDLYSSAMGNEGSITLNIDPLEGLTFSASLFFNNPAVVGGTKQSGYSYGSFSLRQRLLEKKLNITLRVNDPFNMQKWESSYESPEFRTEMSGRWSSRFIGLNVSYTFGTTPRLEQHRQEKSETKGSGGSGSGGGGGGQ